ncbi:MAG TPA: choice-of-anchor D domain-containing protein [Edaphobacter sp.]|jgi:hypothetical protein|nr:choice-of-anchor D domain-containing protein [Edaphobacter sp.]
MGGLTPVSGATIQMYAVGTTGAGSPATPLFATSLTTDASGNFDFAGAYTCPTADALVYMVATGGDPGVNPGTVNPQLNMMVVLGRCGDLTPTTKVTINEVTTAAAVWTLAPFMNAANGIGSDAGDASTLASAFQMVLALANPATGTAPGAGSQGGVPVSEINTLADILASCVNSTGGAAGDGSSCGKLFEYTTQPGGAAPTDVMSAALALVNNPTQNVQQLYSLLPANAPFQPVLAAAPQSFALPAITTGLYVSRPTITFPDTYTGSTAVVQEMVKNNGTSPVQISSIDLSGANASEFGVDTTNVSNGCSTTKPLAPAALCTIAVSFSPVSDDHKTATLQIVSDAVDPLLRIPLSGEGVALAPGAFTITDQSGAPASSLTFTKAGVPQNLTVTNTGTGTLNLFLQKTSTLGTLSDFKDTCGGILFTLNPGQSCVFGIQLNALVPGAGKGSILVQASAGDGVPVTQTVEVIIPASGVNFSAAPVSLGEWGFLPPPGTSVTSTPVTISVTAGNNTQTPAAPHASIAAPSDFAVSGESCGVGECKISVTFTPSAPGNRTATLVTDYGNVPLTGTGIQGPSFLLSPFEPLNISVTNTEDVTVLNNGSEPLSLTTYNYSTYFNVTNQCPAPLESGATCTIKVVFAPFYSGTTTGSMDVVDSRSGIVRSLAFVGYSPPTPPTSEPTSLTFGPTQVGTTSAAQTVNLFARATDQINLTMGSTTDASGDFSVTPASCRGTCTVSITFTPSATGTRQGSIVVTDAVNGLTSSIALQGTGAQPSIGISPGSITFPATPAGSLSATQMVTVKNNGTVPIGITKSMIAGANPEDFEVVPGTNCPTSGLAPGATCTVPVIFQPQAQGAFQGLLQLTTTDPNNSTLTVALSGTGLPPVGLPSLVITPTSMSFPDTYVGGTSESQPVEITNNSPYEMNLSFTNGDDFGGGPGCSSLQPGSSCRGLMGFTPRSSGEKTEFFKVQDTNSGYSVRTTLSGNGLANEGGPLVFSPSSVAIDLAGVPQEVSLINGGSSPVTIEGISGAVSSNDCPKVLPAEATCHLYVEALQKTGAVQNLTASVQATSSATPYTLPITVSARADGTSMDVTPLDFGVVPLGSSRTLLITLHGFKFLPLLTTQVTGPNATEFTAMDNPEDSCSATYIVSCSAIVTFTPTANGLRTATVETPWGNVAVSGIGGVSPNDGADFTLTTRNLLTPAVQGYVGTVTVTNTGTAPLIMTNAAGSAPAYFYTDGCLNKQLQVGESCSANISFSGGPGTGLVSQALIFTDLLSGTSKPLNLTGVQSPAVTSPSVSIQTLQFDNVAVGGTGDVQYVSVTGADGHPLIIKPVQADNFLIDPGTCPQGTPCQIGVRFHPSAGGYLYGSVVVTDRITGGYTVFSMQGIGGFPKISVSPSSVVFPMQPIGTTWANMTVAVSNIGDAPLGLSSFSLAGNEEGNFSAAWGNCAPPAQACIQVGFVPRSLGGKTAALQIMSNDPDTPVLSVPLSATSTPVQ